jgi:hypothetical protein
VIVTWRNGIVVVACALVACAASGCQRGSGDSPSGVSCDPTPNAPIAWSDVDAKLEAALGGDFVVQRGQMKFFRVSDCVGLSNCFGNNPTSPYGFWCLPPADGATVAETEIEKICPPDLRPTWRLREDEAVIAFGRTPPRAKYVGFRSYVYSRTIADGSRKVLFASMGDTLNPLTLSTSGTPCAQAGSAWDADFALITTADANLEKALTSTLAQFGVSRAIVNDDLVPRSLVKMGLDDGSDDLAMLFRVALFDDAAAAAGDAWMNDPPITVLRITPRTPKTIAPYAVPDLRPRGTGTTEADLETPLRSLVDAIEAANADGKITETRLISIAPEGLTCLQSDENCLGDNQDTLYLASAPSTIEDVSTGKTCSFVLAGVNTELTGKATYLNVSLYETKKIMGIVSVTGAQLRGTAARFGATEPKLWSWEFARDCGTRSSCTVVPIGDLGVPTGERLNFIARPYLEPATKTAPDSGEVVMPYVVQICR